MWTSYQLALEFLSSLGDPDYRALLYAPNSEYPPRGEMPKPKDASWGIKPDIIVRSPFYGVTAVVQCSMFTADKVFFCHAFDAPSMVKPKILNATWLHLHIAILLACERDIFTPSALEKCKVNPVIFGLKPQLPINFPLALAALHYAIHYPNEDEPQPF